MARGFSPIGSAPPSVPVEPHNAALVAALCVGRLRQLGSSGHLSGILKRPIKGDIELGTSGFAGDEQGDRRHHGGPEKAVHQYPSEHLPAWRRDFPGQRERFRPGSLGENLSTIGMTEDAVCIGDTYRLGSAVLQVSQGRQPCWRIDEHFGVRGMAKYMQETRRTGWYCRVIEPGFAAAGLELVRLARPRPDWTIARILKAFYFNLLDIAELQVLAEIPELSESWRCVARKRVERASVETWDARLNTPGAGSG